MLEIGNKAPDFSGRDQNGKEISLSDYKGKRVALYFYTKDDTPGCTKQACSLRDGFSDLIKNNIEVIGVSADDAESHQKFIKKYNLPFPLIADTDMEIINKYGVYGEKNMYGKKYMGIKRTTFLINEDGKLTKIFKRVKTAEHSDEILKAFE
jgi:peroxiredoxin Q/BCP